MKYEQRIQAFMDRFEEKYGIPTVLGLAIDVLGLFVGGYLLLQPGILLTAVGFVVGIASLGGFLNKTLHGGSS